jgi:hypothetical protein
MSIATKLPFEKAQGGAMNLLTKMKKVVAFAALTITLTLSVASVPQNAGVFKFEAGSASAAARRYRIVWYYSDATFTTRVGIGHFRCDGSSGLSGRSTPYFKEVFNEPCCGNVLC